MVKQKTEISCLKLQWSNYNFSYVGPLKLWDHLSKNCNFVSFHREIVLGQNKDLETCLLGSADVLNKMCLWASNKPNRNDLMLHCRSSVNAELQGFISVQQVHEEQSVDNVVLSKTEPLR